MRSRYSVTKKLLKLAVCAVAKYQYYCEVNFDSRGMPRGVYTFSTDDQKYTVRDYDIITRSDVVWRQGPGGGVKITKDRHIVYPLGYITSSKKHMKKFFWIKLQAKELA